MHGRDIRIPIGRDTETNKSKYGLTLGEGSDDQRAYTHLLPPPPTPALRLIRHGEVCRLCVCLLPLIFLLVRLQGQTLSSPGQYHRIAPVLFASVFHLSSPSLATEKKSDSGEDDRLLFAVSEMQGWRISASIPIFLPFSLTTKSFFPCIQPWRTLTPPS